MFFLFLQFCLLQADSVTVSGAIDKSDEDYFIAKGFESRNDVRDFFEGRTESDIYQLKHHSNPKVSLYAAWLKCVLKSKFDPTLSKVEKTEFLNFLSGRINTPIPEWWKQQILEKNLKFGHGVSDLGLSRFSRTKSGRNEYKKAKRQKICCSTWE